MQKVDLVSGWRAIWSALAPIHLLFALGDVVAILIVIVWAYKVALADPLALLLV